MDILDTERLRLRQLTPDDLPVLRRMMQDEQVMYAFNGPFGDEEMREWMDRQFARYREYGHGLWAVVLKETDEVIGRCGLTIQPWKDRSLLEVGYLFSKEHWHKGYATEAASACLQYAFEYLDAPAVYALILDTNAASRRVAERLGMQPVDTWTRSYRGADMPQVLYEVKRMDRQPADELVHRT